MKTTESVKEEVKIEQPVKEKQERPPKKEKEVKPKAMSVAPELISTPSFASNPVATPATSVAEGKPVKEKTFKNNEVLQLQQMLIAKEKEIGNLQKLFDKQEVKIS